ncbi:hypothetical protein [Microlunatus soli]|uniref:Uncharacterized protein n=1 Tax=Microlunatus soli TaxID=630515 RepID=A0A1H1U226_9ACTN|nr:hypothetical protein [Microlunatus soli]SDS66411.1 hypothetical protein SAMN04489812_2606 [Microlunatus soli]
MAAQTPDADLQAVSDAAETIREATLRRDEAMAAARDAGNTWRSIALAAEMTENGVIKAVQRHLDQVAEQEDQPA